MAPHHRVFQGPFPVELERVTIPTPENYAHYHQDPPLPPQLDGWKVHEPFTNGDGRRVYGSVAVNSGFDDSPDGEVISAGVNSKGPYWVSIGRHGNYLMWGFQAPPSKLTASGRAVFLNCVSYIAGFDHQVPRSLKKFIGRDWWLDQALKMRDIQQEHARLKKLEEERGEPLPASISPGTLEQFIEKTAKRQFPDLWEQLRGDLAAYHPAMVANRGFLVASGNEFSPARIDADAKAYGIANNDPRLLEHCIARLERGEDVERAQRVLLRYTGLRFTTAMAWRSWYEAAKDGLYFSDTGGYRFFPAKPTQLELEQRALAASMPEPSEEAPVQLQGTLLVDPGRSTSGTLAVRVRLAAGWHIYASAGKDSPYQETRLSLDLPEAVRGVGDWALPKSLPSPETPALLLWEGDVVFQHRIEADSPAALAKQLKVSIQLQACDSNGCRPPETVQVICTAR